jgi:hypothetical protein
MGRYTMKVTTNNQPRDVIEAHELTLKEREEFDYINWKAVERGEESPEFFRYKGELYDLGEFFTARTLWPTEEWDGYQSDTYFSGTVVKLSNDGETVIVGRFCT